MTSLLSSSRTNAAMSGLIQALIPKKKYKGLIYGATSSDQILTKTVLSPLSKIPAINPITAKLKYNTQATVYMAARKVKKPGPTAAAAKTCAPGSLPNSMPPAIAPEI